MNNQTPREYELTMALKERHDGRGDFFASQVKMGSFGNKILDAIAIPVSWSPRTVIGYEIKVSRSDFLNDQKYPHYMETCNLFYFVVPKGLIDKNEVPDRVGILEYNNGRLRQTKKASYSRVEINADMLFHCIFYKLEAYKKPKSRAEHLADIQAKVESRDYGHAMSEKIRRLEISKTTYEHENWIHLQESIKKKFGEELRVFEILNMLDPTNRKYNESVKILERAIDTFMEERKK